MSKHKPFPCWFARTLCVLMLVGEVYAQQPANASNEPAATRQTPAPLDDEIVVTGDRSLSTLEMQAGRLTLNFYDLLNNAIDEKEFKIDCQVQFRTGTQIQKRVCRPRYVESLEARQAGRLIQHMKHDEENNDGSIDVDPSGFIEIDYAIAMKQRAFNEKILQAVNEDPALNRAFWELLALKQEIESIRESD